MRNSAVLLGQLAQMVTDLNSTSGPRIAASEALRRGVIHSVIQLGSNRTGFHLAPETVSTKCFRILSYICIEVFLTAGVSVGAFGSLGHSPRSLPQAVHFFKVSCFNLKNSCEFLISLIYSCWF